MVRFGEPYISVDERSTKYLRSATHDQPDLLHSNLDTVTGLKRCLDTGKNVEFFARHLPSVMNVFIELVKYLLREGVDLFTLLKVFSAVCPFLDKDVPLVCKVGSDFWREVKEKLLYILIGEEYPVKLCYDATAELGKIVDRYGLISDNHNKGYAQLNDLFAAEGIAYAFHRTSEHLRAQQTLEVLKAGAKPHITNGLLGERVITKDAALITYKGREIDVEAGSAMPPALLTHLIRNTSRGKKLFNKKSPETLRKYHWKPFNFSENYVDLALRAQDISLEFADFARGGTGQGMCSMNVSHQQYIQAIVAQLLSHGDFKQGLTYFWQLHEYYPVRNGNVTIFVYDPKTHHTSLGAYNAMPIVRNSRKIYYGK